MLCFVLLRLRLACRCTATSVVVDYGVGDSGRRHGDLISCSTQLRGHRGSTGGGGRYIGGWDVSGTLTPGEQQIERW
jgi:hypothetical protein